MPRSQQKHGINLFDEQLDGKTGVYRTAQLKNSIEEYSNYYHIDFFCYEKTMDRRGDVNVSHR